MFAVSNQHNVHSILSNWCICTTISCGTPTPTAIAAAGRGAGAPGKDQSKAFLTLINRRTPSKVVLSIRFEYLQW